MLNQNLDLARNKMEQTLSFVDSELSKIRTGRANPDMFNKILINYYDNETPLNQVANISLMDGVTISIQPFDKTFIDEIEKAIVESDVNKIKSVKGIGLKTAERIILELKDKISKQDIEDIKFVQSFDNTIRNEALSALSSLGISKNVVERHIDNIIDRDNKITLEELIREVLKRS